MTEPRTPSHTETISMGRRLDWLDAGTIRGGEAGWQRVADGGPAARRDSLPAWLIPELVSTRPACEKLRGWLDRHTAPATPLTPGDVLARIQFCGDEVLAHLTARLLAERLPPPVCQYAIDRVTFLGVGFQKLGLCGPPLPSQGRPWLISLSAHRTDDPSDVDDLVAHEIAHAWLLEEPGAAVVSRTAFWHQTVLRLPMADVPADVEAQVRQQRRLSARDETEARRLTRAWGFKDRGL
jgi:hypothetical protein